MPPGPRQRLPFVRWRGAAPYVSWWAVVTPV